MTARIAFSTDSNYRGVDNVIPSIINQGEDWRIIATFDTALGNITFSGNIETKEGTVHPFQFRNFVSDVAEGTSQVEIFIDSSVTAQMSTKFLRNGSIFADTTQYFEIPYIEVNQNDLSGSGTAFVAPGSALYNDAPAYQINVTSSTTEPSVIDFLIRNQGPQGIPGPQVDNDYIVAALEGTPSFVEDVAAEIDLTEYTKTTDLTTQFATNATNSSSYTDIEVAKTDVDVATNASNIASNVTAINTNANNISANTSNISTIGAEINTNSDLIATNASNISAVGSTINTNTNNIQTNTAAIAANAVNITTNATNISGLSSSILSNTGRIADNETAIGENDAAIGLKANTTTVNLALDAKANTADVTSSLALKANTSTVNTALNLKANTADVTNSLAANVTASNTYADQAETDANTYTDEEIAKLDAIPLSPLHGYSETNSPSVTNSIPKFSATDTITWSPDVEGSGGGGGGTTLTTAQLDDINRIDSIELAKQDRLSADQILDINRIDAIESAKQDNLSAAQLTDINRIDTIESAKQDNLTGNQLDDINRIDSIEIAKQDRLSTISFASIPSTDEELFNNIGNIATSSTLNYTGDDLTSVTIISNGLTYTKTLNFTNDVLTSVSLTEPTLSLSLTKTLNYDGQGVLTGTVVTSA